MEAHVLAHFIDSPQPAFPFICLTVSGGHTQLVLVNSPLDMEVLGETQDDAVGEAFDKIAKIIGLPYPGGPHLDKLAAKGNPQAFTFPLSDMKGLSFSFSGIKTAVLKERGIKEIAIAGGVSANSGLRETIMEEAKKYRWNVYLPKLEYCTDNAAMVAMAAHFKFQAGIFTNLNVSPLAKLKIGNHG